MNTVSLLIMSTPQKCINPKENMHNIAFSFGITHFWGADIIRGDTVCALLTGNLVKSFL